MNDRGRFSQQINRTLEVLRNSVRKLKVPLAEKDNLLGLVRDLREFAHQAGRAEKVDEPQT